jgi:hypothetical protein
MFSYREKLMDYRSHDIRVRLLKSRNGCFGQVDVGLGDGSIDLDPDERTLRFYCSRIEGDWKLDQVEYP